MTLVSILGHRTELFAIRVNVGGNGHLFPRRAGRYERAHDLMDAPPVIAEYKHHMDGCSRQAGAGGTSAGK